MPKKNRRWWDEKRLSFKGILYSANDTARLGATMALLALTTLSRTAKRKK